MSNFVFVKERACTYLNPGALPPTLMDSSEGHPCRVGKVCLISASEVHLCRSLTILDGWHPMLKHLTLCSISAHAINAKGEYGAFR